MLEFWEVDPQDCSLRTTIVVTNFCKNFNLIVEDKRRKYDQLGRAGLSNGHGHSGYPSNNGYSRFSEDFLNRTFHFHNPFDIFEQFMSHFGMDDDFGMLIYLYSQIEI